MKSPPPTPGIRYNNKNCFVVIAAYNEEKHIADVIKRVQKQGFSNIIVADDGSKDRTQIIAERAGVIVIHHIVNLGKGAAMKSGADYAKLQGAKAIIFMDGDGQHKPEELPLFVRELNKGYAIIFGYRKRNTHMPIVQKFGNWFLSTVIKIFYSMDLIDALSGYRALTIKAYDTVRWTSRDYSVESEMIARAGKNSLSYTQFEIATIYHDKYKGTTFLDGIPIMINLIWWRMTH